MRSRSRFLPAAASVACALLLLAGPVALAQEESPAAPPSPFCSVLTAEELGPVLGVEMSVESSSDLDCTYQADSSTGAFLFVNVRREDGTVEELKEFWTDYADVTVGGRPALIAPDATLLFVGLDDGLFTVQVIGSVGEGVDQAAAVTALAELALPRVATIPLPTPEPEPSEFPMPSFVGDPELVSLFPTTLGGEPLEIQSFSGAEIRMFGDADALAQVEEALTAAGRTFDDLSLAFGFNQSSGLTAIRIKGMDVASVLDQLLPLLLENVDDPVQTPTEIAGKPVIAITDGQNADAPTQYLYPKGEVIWQVTAAEPVLTEALSALP